jgi:L-threonylcarbamoyladenylate synthase
MTSFEATIRAGGVVLFGADTVYGLACDPASEAAVGRLYALKGRDAGKPAAVMFFGLDVALAALPDLGPRTRGAFEALLPGPLTLLVANPDRRFPLACGPDAARLGVRVPALAGPAIPILQSSANAAGEPDARRLSDVPASIREGADLVLDAGELPGTPSTVLDLGAYESSGGYTVLRAGAVGAEQIASRLNALAPRG